jgi:hypothetical protein
MIATLRSWVVICRSFEGFFPAAGGGVHAFIGGMTPSPAL